MIKPFSYSKNLWSKNLRTDPFFKGHRNKGKRLFFCEELVCFKIEVCIVIYWKLIQIFTSALCVADCVKFCCLVFHNTMSLFVGAKVKRNLVLRNIICYWNCRKFVIYVCAHVLIYHHIRSFLALIWKRIDISNTK